MSAGAALVTGAEYVAAITAHADDRRYRDAFQALALGLSEPGSTLFDFGSGPGLDARCYAEHGRRVLAYDIDPRMSDYFDAYCRDLIEAGTVTLQRGDYRQFLNSTPAARAELVVSNFAPLSLVSDLAELFAKFAALTSANGAVLASVLSPYYLGDLRYGWWWGNAARLAREGRYAVPGAQAPVWRRRVTEFARQCTPAFRLTEVFAGDQNRRLERGAWRPLTRCRFMFLLFRKSGAATTGDGRLSGR